MNFIDSLYSICEKGIRENMYLSAKMKINAPSKIVSVFRSMTLKTILIIVSFVETIFLASSNTPREGLEQIWILPLLFGSCVIIFQKIINYHKGGIGLKIYYIIAIIRYLIQPYLIQITNGDISPTRMSNLAPSSYRIALFIQCFELVIACLTIRFSYPKIILRETKKNKILNLHSEKLRMGGIIVLGFFIIDLALRFNIWFPALKILLLKKNVSYTAVLSEATFFNCIKAFLFAVTVLKATKYKPNTRGFYLFFILSIFLGIFNFISYFGSNRSFILETAITTISLLYYQFPKYRNHIMVITIPIAISLIFIMFVTKQFGVDSASEFSADTLSAKYISNQIEEYTNGLWCIGQTYQASIGMTIQHSIQAFCKEITDSLTIISGIRGFHWIPQLTLGTLSSAEIMKYSFETFDRGQMLSFSGDFLITFNFLGWIVFPIANYLVIRLLVIFEVKSKLTEHVFYKYLYIWMACLFALTHCYSIQTLLYCCVNFALFYWIILKANRRRIRVKW
ncbi:hypothetical protein HPT25_05490 [Bacillus sp. BRMEA1]|uniref:hypothetical protein n=1 Tax=Neobacillus endophyticus TaxID=2738405 RepID=UPI001565C41C|nr:hypothetical protein [Neobacillus endophyticus]NRD76946.1 hypothetical protein [Neobacillus endophyticus]